MVDLGGGCSAYLFGRHNSFDPAIHHLDCGAFEIIRAILGDELESAFFGLIVVRLGPVDGADRNAPTGFAVALCLLVQNVVTRVLLDQLKESLLPWVGELGQGASDNSNGSKLRQSSPTLFDSFQK